MAPEEENRAQPKMREQIVDLLSVCCSCCTCTHSLCLRVAPPHPNTSSLLSSCSRRFEITSHLFQGWKNRRDFMSSIQFLCLHPSKRPRFNNNGNKNWRANNYSANLLLFEVFHFLSEFEDLSLSDSNVPQMWANLLQDTCSSVLKQIHK